MTITYLPTVKAFSPQKLEKPTHVNLLEIFISSSHETKVKTHPTPATPSAFCFHLSSMTVRALPSYSLDVTSGNVSQTCFLSFKPCHKQGYRLCQVLMTPRPQS